MKLTTILTPLLVGASGLVSAAALPAEAAADTGIIPIIGGLLSGGGSIGNTGTGSSQQSSSSSGGGGLLGSSTGSNSGGNSIAATGGDNSGYPCSGLYGVAACCQVSVLDVADLVCTNAPGNPLTAQRWRTGCEQIGSKAKCCVLRVENLAGVLCRDL